MKKEVYCPNCCDTVAFKTIKQIEETTNKTDLDQFEEYFNNRELLKERFEKFSKEVNDILSDYKLSNDQISILESGLTKLAQQANSHGEKDLLSAIEKLNKELSNGSKGTKTASDKKLSSFSHFNARQDIGYISGLATKRINEFKAASTQERQRILKEQQTAQSEWNKKYLDNYKKSINALSQIVKPEIAKVKRETSQNSYGNVKSSVENISASSVEYINAIGHIVKELSQSSNGIVNNIKNIQTNYSLDSELSKLSLEANKKMNTWALDFESTYEKEGNHAYNPVTHGLSNGTETHSGLIVGDKDALDRIITFLTDTKMHESQRILAEQMGLGKRDASGNYLKANGKDIITEEELREYITERYIKALGDGGSGEVKALTASESAFGYASEAMNVLTMDYIVKDLQDKNIVIANKRFDIGLYNSMVDKKHQIDVKNTSDLFELALGDKHFRGGYTVENLAKMFLPNYESSGAHGAGFDAETEARLLAL